MTGHAELLHLPSRHATAEPTLLRWTLLCAAAEAIGMTAASGAARAAQHLDSTWRALAVIVAAGLVEGLALGSAQAWALHRWLPALRRRRYVLATVLVAGLGWAAGSAPSVLSADQGGAAPPLTTMLLGAAGIGLLAGPLLGAAQAATLRDAAPHPWRWVGANLAAWPPAMALIFLGAGTPGDDWPWAGVLVVGLATGAAAGAALGLVTGWFLPSLTGAAAHNRVLLQLLSSSWRGPLDQSLLGLEVPGRRTGRCYRLPVQYAVDDGTLLVVPGHAERKTWWRNLRGRSAPVEVLWRGEWVPGRAELLEPGDPGHAESLATYAARWPRAALPEGQVVVRIRDAVGNP